MLKNLKKCIALILAIIAFNSMNAQTKKSALLWDGMTVAGYVNDGAFVNFGGPSIKLVKRPWSIGVGVLPTLRIKQDQVVKGAAKNSPVMPTAGVGATVVYKHFVAQVPFYYNAKTATTNGKWNVGFGIGYKF